MEQETQPDACEWRAWERVEHFTALAYGGLALVVCLLVAMAFRQGLSLVVTVPLSVAASAGMYQVRTRRLRRRRRLLRLEFPAKWEAVLQRDVAFFRALGAEERDRFRRHVQLFIAERRITGIGVEADTTTRVLVAASAVIPIFGFPGWEWHQINEVLVYPSRFDHDFSTGDTADHGILGMVGTGAMNRLMILSKPDLIAGFRNPGDKRNVGVHEFVHLVDLSDGAVDGMPLVGLDRGAVSPWIELVRRKMREIEAGASDIHPYALTNEAEFLAVTAEYFFERPGVMRQKHPQLYAALERVFNQDLGSRLARIRREMAPPRRRFGRNSPCPCGSGLKFKKCCVRRQAAIG
jgi:Mlc titration factor MtfA (ptsG expression regulator)